MDLQTGFSRTDVKVIFVEGIGCLVAIDQSSFRAVNWQGSKIWDDRSGHEEIAGCLTSATMARMALKSP